MTDDDGLLLLCTLVRMVHYNLLVCLLEPLFLFTPWPRVDHLLQAPT
jgi:hypothetical protein